MAQATRRLAGSLAATQLQRRELSRKMLDLQEAERARLAHELHDELAQGLTALRVRAAWLGRRHERGLLSREDLEPIETACEHMQRDVRALLVGLRPFGGPDGLGGRTSMARLVSLLQALVLRWNEGPRPPTPSMQISLACTDAQGNPCEWPQGAHAESIGLPAPVAHVIYRISQESLTNAARHACAGAVTIGLHLTLDARAGAASLAWECMDDGVGIEDLAAAMRRGNGLAGINQRVWAVGADLAAGAATGDAGRPGLRLAARFDLAPD
jgi:two-component system, NarL family, sensor histidine kinase UhpB